MDAVGWLLPAAVLAGIGLIPDSALAHGIGHAPDARPFRVHCKSRTKIKEKSSHDDVADHNASDSYRLMPAFFWHLCFQPIRRFFHRATTISYQ